MKAIFEAPVTGTVLAAVTAILEGFDPSKEGWSEPTFQKCGPARYEYVTASGKGRWLIDLSSEGLVIVVFEGRRNSLLWGGRLLYLDSHWGSVIPALPTEEMPAVFLSFVEQGTGATVTLWGHFSHMESSTPEVPLSGGG